MQLAPTPLIRTQDTRDPRITWSSLRLLPLHLWATLLITLVVALSLAGASLGEEALRGPAAQVLLLAMALLTLGVLAVLTRVFLLQAERQAHLARRVPAESASLPVPATEDAHEDRTRELSALVTRLLQRTESDKAGLARDLHDELGGLLTAAKMDLSWLQARIEEPALRARLAQLGGVLDEAMNLKRRVVEDLRPSLLDHFGLATALRAHVESACAKAGLARELALPDDLEPLPRDTALVIFRVVQEGLTNTIRHARAARVKLMLSADATDCAFELSDDGCGFDAATAPASLGIPGMRHRVRTLGGELDLRSAPGQGTTLRVKVPVAPATSGRGRPEATSG